MIVFKNVLPYLNNMKLDPFKQMLLTLMRLRLDLNLQYLAYKFGVSKCTVSKVFLETLLVMYCRLVPTHIVWPERELLLKTLPLSFLSKFRVLLYNRLFRNIHRKSK